MSPPFVLRLFIGVMAVLLVAYLIERLFENVPGRTWLAVIVGSIGALLLLIWRLVTTAGLP